MLDFCPVSYYNIFIEKSKYGTAFERMCRKAIGASNFKPASCKFSFFVFARGGLIFLCGKERKMTTVKEVIASGITPIFLEYSRVKLFESDEKILRSFITVNSLDLGTLGYRQYRFVARRTKLGAALVRRHLEKLFRAMPEILRADPEISLVTVPVYAKLLTEGELAAMLVDIQSLYFEVPPRKVCIELSADILYEDLSVIGEKISELRNLGYKVAICEVGDCFCPVFRLSEIEFDYAFMDSYSTESLDKDTCERIAGSLVHYLHHLDAKVIAPGLDSKEKIEGAKRIGIDGYTEDATEVITFEEETDDSPEESLSEEEIE